MPAITDALKAVKLAEQLRKPIIGVIVTRVKKDDIELEPEVVKEMLDTPILGMIPEDTNVRRAIRDKSTVVHKHPKSNSARAYKEIAAKLLGVPYDSKKDIDGMFTRVLKKLGLKT